MERILRRKFICVAMGVVAVVLLTMAMVINFSNYMQIDDVADEVIVVLSENGGHFPPNFDRGPMQHLTQETPYSTRYFTVRLDEDGVLSSIDTRYIQMVDADQAVSYLETVQEVGKQEGFVDRYKYQVVEQGNDTLVIFVDCGEEMAIFQNLLVSSAWVCVIALLAVFVLIVVLSKQVVAPIIESYQKQQQFITNITHELKTPLAIVKTNTEVIELSQGSTQWSRSIHNQIGRLNQLVNHLVSLCKMDEDGHQMTKVSFSLSDAVSEAVEPFEVMVAEKGMVLDCHVEDGIGYCGEESSLRLLVSILMENAVKYGNDTIPIGVTLRQNRGKIQLKITNGAEGLKQGNYAEIFQRFYRMDDARNSQQGGFGIGLAMARTIVRNHGGSIQAKSPDGLCLEIQVDL